MRSFAAIVIVLTVADVADGGGHCSGVRGGCGRSSYRTSDSLPSYSPPKEPTYTPSTRPAPRNPLAEKPVNSGCGTVHVRGYTRKDGKTVSSHNRGRPDCGGSSPTYRTSARTSARTSYWNGTGSEPDDESLYAPVPTKPAGYLVHFANGKTRVIADYQDHGDTFSIVGTTGHNVSYPRWMIESIEPLKAKADGKTEELTPCYIAHFTKGMTEPILDFDEEDGDSWVLFGVSGSRLVFLKSMIAYFEPTRDAIGAMRKWTDSAGAHHAIAKFFRIDGQKVVLVKDNGKTAHVPIDKLSEVDQDLARRLQELMAKR